MTYLLMRRGVSHTGYARPEASSKATGGHKRGLCAYTSIKPDFFCPDVFIGGSPNRNKSIILS